MRTLVFGNSGSGKSSYAKRLAAAQGLTHFDLDTIVWEPGQVAVARAAAAVNQSLQTFIDTHADWVIEGCYGDLVSTAAEHCDELIFLNPGRKACLANNRQRRWEPHKYASMATQEAMLEHLQAWVASYDERADDCSYRRHRALFDSHAGPKREIRALPEFAEGPPPP